MDGLSDAKINAAHSVDVRLRINGQDEWWCGESYIKGLICEVATLRKRVEDAERDKTAAVERERWECHQIAAKSASRIGADSAEQVRHDIAARGPMLSPVEEP